MPAETTFYEWPCDEPNDDEIVRLEAELIAALFELVIHDWPSDDAPD